MKNNRFQIDSRPSFSLTPKVNNATLQNGFGEAIGFQDWGYTFTTTGTELSQVNTLFYNNRWYLVSNMRQLLNELYVEHGLVQTIINVPVDDALRGGVEISSKQLSEEQIMELQTSLDRDDDLTVVGDAAKWNRLFGGAGILIMTDQDPTTPLDLSLIDKDSNLEFRAADLWELFWDKQNTEGYDPEIQFNNFEYYNYYARTIHKSRVMRLKGLTAPSFVRPRLRGWGFSVIEQLVRSINQYLKATDLAFEILDELKIDVYKIKNLTDTLFTAQGEAAVAKRIRMANWQKNYQNCLIMDGEDDFIQKQLSFAGFADVMKEIRMQIACDMRMPLTKLFGVSASGFNSGEDDIEVYNSMVESTVRNKIKYDLLRIIEIKCQKLFGFIPDDIDITFKPLRMLNSVDEENVKTQKFNRLLSAKTSGEISTFEFREGCNRDKLLGIQLDNMMEKLNPDDPQVGAIVSNPHVGVPAQPDSARLMGDDPSPYETLGPSVEDPGANREDTRKPYAWDPTTVQPRVPHSDLELEGQGDFQRGNPQSPRKGTGSEVYFPTGRDEDTKWETVQASPPVKQKPRNMPKSPPAGQRVRNNVFNKIFGVFKMKNDYRSEPSMNEHKKEFEKLNAEEHEKFMNPGHVDEGLWDKAKKASKDAFGEVKWPFVMYLYKKWGGK